MARLEKKSAAAPSAVLHKSVCQQHSFGAIIRTNGHQQNTITVVTHRKPKGVVCNMNKLRRDPNLYRVNGRNAVAFAGPMVRMAILLAALASATSGQAAPRQFLQGHVPRVTARMTPVGRLDATTNLNLAIGLPLRNLPALTNLLQQVYDPASPQYRHFLTPEQFAAQFGPTKADYQAVIAFAEAHGLHVTATHPNRVVLDVNGPVAQIEQALHVNMRTYTHPTEARTFYAPDVEPSLDLAVQVLHIGGTDNYSLPRPCRRPATPSLSKANSIMGSGPNGGYMGNDFRAAYLPGCTLTGAGQSVGLLQFAAYNTNDIIYYEDLAGLSHITLTNVLVDGFSGISSGGYGEDEVCLDIEMVASMAPGVSSIIVYETGNGSPWEDILSRIANDNQAKQIGASWTGGTTQNPNAEQIFLQMAAQGQSYFNASGDSDAYAGTIDFPADSPNVTVVGGTTLTTTGPGGAWVSETVWNYGGSIGSSGGISTYYTLPAWQQGIDMTANHGSTTMRNMPDVALTADNVYLRTGGKNNNEAGTSCATPLWAGLTALINERNAAMGAPPIGFINPTVYALARRGDYNNCFHDITTGNNFSSRNPTNFPAVPGYDLCTGVGTPFGMSLINALTDPLLVAPDEDLLFFGPVGGPFVPTVALYSLNDTGTNAVNWTVGNASAWLTVTPMNGLIPVGAATTTVSVGTSTAANSLPAGYYSGVLAFTNLNDGFVQSRPVALQVLTVPVISTQPTNTAVPDGAPAIFVVVSTNTTLLTYQWYFNGTNLSDGGVLSGSGTSTLTINSVSTTNVGTYSVLVSNVAGFVISADAALTIASSPPVITVDPADTTVLPGASATFDVQAVGDHPFTYQWCWNGTNLSDSALIHGSTNSHLLVSNVTYHTTGGYSVVVSNLLGSATSRSATLAVVPVTIPGATLEVPHAFGGGSDGESPNAPLLQAMDGRLYGTMGNGGTYGYGTVFGLTTNGVFANLVSFDASHAYPEGLVQTSDGVLYGTAEVGGAHNRGAVFRLTTNGVLSTIASFSNTDGTFPQSKPLLAADGNLYGVTQDEGVSGRHGTVFQTTTNGSLTTLLFFNGTNGAGPHALMQGTDGNLYGTTSSGGTNNKGIFFRMTTAGVLTNLYSFGNGSDSGSPTDGPLVQDRDGVLYGTTMSGGANGCGSLFAITTNGAFSTRWSFNNDNNGNNPIGGLLLCDDGNLYGTAARGGTYNCGTVFRLTSPNLLTNVVTFDGYQGSYSMAPLIETVDGSLYGTTADGGSGSTGVYNSGMGVIFRVSFHAPLQFLLQPVSQAVMPGTNVTLRVAMSGSLPVSYQWLQNGTNLANSGNVSGATNYLLALNNVTPTNSGSYTVVASNVFGSVTSQVAVLSVPAFDHFAFRSMGSTQWVGTPFGMTLSARDVNGATIAIYQAAVMLTGAGDTGPVDLQPAGIVFTNGVWTGNAVVQTAATNVLIQALDPIMGYAGMSTPFNVLYGAPMITAQPTNLTLVPGAPAIFTVGMTASSPYYCQWSFNGTNMSDGNGVVGSTTTMLTVSNVTSAQVGTYAVVISNSFGLVTSSDATLAVVSVTGTNVTCDWICYCSSSAGYSPGSGLLQGADGSLYGVMEYGGDHGAGTVFRLTTNGVMTTLASFDLSNGENPAGRLFQAPDGNLYGTAGGGGTSGRGTVFRMTTNGVITRLASFDGTRGQFPVGGMVMGPDNCLYGTTPSGGANSQGVVYKVTTNGVLTCLVSFNLANGAMPFAGLVLGADGNLYGTTRSGGDYSAGTVFRMTTNGVLTTLLSFNFANGVNPSSCLVQDCDGMMYGTTQAGGSSGFGTVFQMTTNGTLTTIHSFVNDAQGGDPSAGLCLGLDGNLYGTTSSGGAYGDGTVFRVSPTGAVSVLFQLDGYQGADSSDALVQTADGTLYGTAKFGGEGYSGSSYTGNGTIFRLGISGAPQITVQPVSQTVGEGSNVLLHVASFGGMPVCYQWLKNGANLTDSGSLSGSAARVLALNNVTVADLGSYSVSVSNAFGAVVSSAAILTVHALLAPLGTPVWWLTQHGLTTNRTPAQAEQDDSDGDGVPNWQEYLADTDPTNASSCFKILAISNLPPWTVYFGSSTARVYTLEGSTNLALGNAGFHAIGTTNIFGLNQILELPGSSTKTQFFYRVRAQLPP
jgi:uncharacterized repeat protein (TIGR03803 family)